ncbi:Exopolysaccharide biosynthesis protein EpsI, predicted pyruvyl transferase [Paenibacillus sp. UNC496MF]|uniref:polysaccharide pyruvyl transferase family protein n=1 Tax=Paenibacillus sp. UNC496MF TaxID=1502753 RepID=UPI0008E8AE9D|nr:polysaccharide pyruvyl transferase family protein [Paenibacillus sp. UNC496MF]SFI28313.1 Exopolysaccharide biosynthesis protein EpsI, predicted pyruvyl transferase [Paenibacillus sp. UNC496MF]
METVQFAHPMDELKNRLRHILNVIPPHSKIYYIDYPVHGNGGDLLIMKGTEAFFRDHRIHVQARYSVLDFPDGLAIPKDHILVLHGGGNFGDLYPAHQKLREKIVADYPGHRVVMLPQTIFYKSQAEFDKTAAVFNRHKDLHLYVRDTLSQEMAKARFKTCQVHLSPDMAHQLWPIRAKSAPDKELLCFLRTDIEKTAEQERLEASGKGDYLDWGTLFNTVEHKSIRVFNKMMQKGSGKLPLSSFWGKYTDYLVNKAVNRFSNYKTVQTSRLHGHILSCLMDKPNILLDNSYGKNASYYRTWTGGIASATLMADPAGK